MWTEERVAQLRKEWAAGLSASQIAKVLTGVSRNAVIGKVHRLALPARATATGARRSRKYASCRAPEQHKQKADAAPSSILPPLNLAFDAREPRQCAAITDVTPYAQRCCGHPVAAASDRPYCAGHLRAFYVPTSKARYR